jgi:hypothetical protein
MTKVFTYSETRQNLASVLSQAEQDGEVIIARRNGKKFILKKIDSEYSPLDVPGLDTGITREEIIASIREGRELDIPERRRSVQSK